jgi:hypothetical protein
MAVEFTRKVYRLFSTLFSTHPVSLSSALVGLNSLPTRFPLPSIGTQFLEGRKCARCSSGTPLNCSEWILFGTLMIEWSLPQ